MLRAYCVAVVVMMIAMTSGCGRDSEELLPDGLMVIYDQPEGGERIGLSDESLPVMGYFYPDKTRVVVKVCFRGRTGYVREGLESIKRNDGKVLSSCIGQLAGGTRPSHDVSAHQNSARH